MIEKVIPVVEKIFYPSLEAKTRYVFNEGGTRSAKTYTLNQVMFQLAANATKPTIISIVSETMPHLRKGAMRDFFLFLKEDELYNESNHNKSENIYTVNNSIIEFFSADATSKVHGPERDYLFANEIQNIKYEIFFHLAQRTRIRVFADWNPVQEFFIHTKYLQDEQYKDDITYIHSTILDNPFVSPEIKKDVERRAKRDNNYRDVYLLGKLGKLEGLVFKDWVSITKMPTEAKVDIYGLDFGYTNDPTALVHVMINRHDIYIDELIYQTGLQNRQTTALMIREDVNRYSPIYADSAEPKSIDEIHALGFNCKPCLKGADSIINGINMVKQYKIHVTERSINLIKELRNYKYIEDKNGRTLNKPIDLFNHAIDAMRYAVQTHMKPTQQTQQVVFRPTRTNKV